MTWHTNTANSLTEYIVVALGRLEDLVADTGAADGVEEVICIVNVTAAAGQAPLPLVGVPLTSLPSQAFTVL